MPKQRQHREVSSTRSPEYKDIVGLPTYTDQAQYQQPGPATSGMFYHKEKMNPSMVFVFSPDPSKAYDDTSQEWKATLKVKCKDVPSLMREGFYWSDANVIQEEGYVSKDIYAWGRDSKKWCNKRHYFLKDIQEEPPRWIATIEVVAVQDQTIYRFDLEQLSLETTYMASATSQVGHQIYGWYYGNPDMCFNAIYEDMPLEGRWPWPKWNSRNASDIDRESQWKMDVNLPTKMD
ncbi:hypothetical protein F5Y09DRAFT_344081 [Xylaria sp. FL1042]|nr:hypothetical protein F5Y09DRAFT_344081 [Xylaria sp. FL1042]